MSDWDKYVDQILHKMNEDETEFEVSDVCSHAAIYGRDGTCWAYSEKMPELKCYTHEIDGMGEVVKVEVNELENAIKAGEGEKRFGDAGLRICGKKFQVVSEHDPADGGVQISGPGGFAGAIACTKTACIIGFVEKNAVDSKKKFTDRFRAFD